MATEDDRKLFVAGLPGTVTDTELREVFGSAGLAVEHLSMPTDRETGRPRGFAFVTLTSAEDALRARGELDGIVLDGRNISVREFQGDGRGDGPRARRGPEGPRDGGPPRRREMGPRDGAPREAGPGRRAPDGATLYVGNLPYDATAKDVEDLVEGTGQGPIVRTHVPVGPDGKVRFGFVTLSSAEAAGAAVEALGDARINGRRLTVNVAHGRGEGTRREGPPGPGARHGPRVAVEYRGRPSEDGGAGRRFEDAEERPPAFVDADRGAPDRGADFPPGEPRFDGAPFGGPMPPFDGGGGGPRGRADDERREKKKKKKRGGGRADRGEGKRRGGGGNRGWDWEED